MTEHLAEIALSMVIVPWVCWCTVSIFNQRQELALMKQSSADLKSTLDALMAVLKSKKKM